MKWLEADEANSAGTGGTGSSEAEGAETAVKTLVELGMVRDFCDCCSSQSVFCSRLEAHTKRHQVHVNNQPPSPNLLTTRPGSPDSRFSGILHAHGRHNRPNGHLHPEGAKDIGWPFPKKSSTQRSWTHGHYFFLTLPPKVTTWG